MTMKHGLSSKMLVYWLMGNAILTICFGLILALICLFPSHVPALHALIVEGSLAGFLPYLIFVLIFSSFISLSYYYDSRSK